jgi:outer membrane protein assembly factor BamD
MRRLTPMRLLALFVCALAVAGCGASVLPSIHSEEERLTAARRLLDKGEYSAATELLKTYVVNNAGSADVDQAIYLLGYAYLKNRAWIEAASEFERLLRDYPESDSSAAARFGYAESDFAQSRGPEFDQEYTHRALDEYQRYLQDFPGHWRNDEARARVLACRTRLADKMMRTAELYLKMHHPGPARVYFEKVVNEYADTPWKPDAEVGVTICEGRTGSPQLAISMFQDIEKRYPGSSASRRAARERKRLEHH